MSKRKKERKKERKNENEPPFSEFLLNSIKSVKKNIFIPNYRKNVNDF